MKSITVWSDGMAILLSKDFADLHGIKNGQQIPAGDVMHLITDHARHQIPKLKMLVEAEKPARSN